MYLRQFAGVDVAQFLFACFAHRLYSSTVVADFHTAGLPFVSFKALAPLVVDADAPLTGATVVSSGVRKVRL